MAKVESGAAQIKLEAKDATCPAFKSVNENFGSSGNSVPGAAISLEKAAVFYL